MRSSGSPPGTSTKVMLELTGSLMETAEGRERARLREEASYLGLDLDDLRKALAGLEEGGPDQALARVRQANPELDLTPAGVEALDPYQRAAALLKAISPTT